VKTKLSFVGPAYTARSPNANAQRAVNCFLELDNASPRAPVALYGTPGTVRQFTLPTGPVRAGWKEGAFSWWVAGGTVYRVDAAYAVLALGTIGTGTGEVGMCSNGQQVLIVDGVGGWIIDTATSALAAITSEGFPAGVTRATYQDGYFIVTGQPGSQSFWINQTPYIGTVWDALDFASAEGSPDNTVGLISDHRELWLFGELSAEVWMNTGSSDFPFQRSGNTFIEHGCAAAGTICKADNTVFWLGADDRGSGIVWRASGYTPARISTHALEHAMAGYVLSDAFAMTYQQEGHIFYVLTFPTSQATWVYDASTQAWHERAWMHPQTGELSRWRANCSVFFNGQHLVGDYESGAVYALDLDAYTDDGGPIKRIRTTATTEGLQNRLFYSSLQVDMETGVGLSVGQGQDPQLMLRYSSDGGHTWSNEKSATVGKVGEYGARAKFNRLGSGRNRVWELSFTDPCKFAILGAVVEGEPGTA
jgi:hypothetical protein